MLASVSGNRFFGVGKLFMLLVGALFALGLAGCGVRKVSKESVFWPPEPNPPRVQFLKAVSGSKDVVKERANFKLLSLDNEEEDAPKIIAKPYGIASSKGRIYIVDTIQNNVAIFDLVKESYEILPGSKGQGKLKKPLNIAIASDGNVFVADTFRKEIMMYDEAGNFIRAYGKEIEMKPVDVAVDDKSIYALDISNNEIKVIDRQTGELSGALGKGTAAEQGLSLPTNLTIDRDGFLYVTNSGTGRVVKLDRDGHIVHSFGRLGDSFGEFGRPRGITVDDKGRIFVADASHQNVQIFNETGRILMFFGDPGYVYESLNLPAGVMVTTENLEYFQKLAAPDFVLEQVIAVTNQFGPVKVSFYGLGQMKDFKGYENLPKPKQKGAAGAAPAEEKK